MLRIVGANPAMDRISTWPALRLGAVNRAGAVSVVPGGKGFNVARAAVRLGRSATAYGFLGGHVGSALREMITRDGVADRHTTIAAGTRVCFIVVEPESGRTTVLNEPGPQVTEGEVERLLDTVRADVGPDDLLVISGSLPDSVSSSVAGELIDIGRDVGARTIVDIHSDALRVAFAHRPWMLKCNRTELLELLGEVEADAPLTMAELAREMQRVREHGIEVVVMTMGPDGALLADADGVAHARVPAIDEVNPTGSGDLLLAGLAVGLEQGRSLREALVLGAACGTAGATHLPPELPPGFDSGSWSSRISLETVNERR
jgi:1-phosphofructokinase family hexose kinase